MESAPQSCSARRALRDCGWPVSARSARSSPETGQQPLPVVAKSSPLLGVYTFGGLGVIIPLLLVTATPDPQLETWSLALVSTAIAGARFAWVVASASRRLYEMTAWLFSYLFLGLAPLVQLRLGVDPGTTPNLDHNFDSISMMVIIAFELSFIIASFFARRADQRYHTENVKRARDVSPARLTVVTCGLIAVALAYVVAVGPVSIWSSRFDRGAAALNAVGDDVLNTVVSATITLGLLVAVVGQISLLRQRRTRGERAGGLALAVALLVLLFVVNPVGSPRFVLITVYLGLLAAVGIFARTSTFRIASLGAVAAMFLIFPVLDSFRFSTSAFGAIPDPVSYLTRGDYDSYGQIVNTTWYVEAFGPTWGNQLLGVLLFWVPRSIWPTKPSDTGIYLAEYKQYTFSNLSAPLPAELFINFSWVGVVVGGMILGVLVRRLDASSEARLREVGAPTVLGSIVPFYMILLLRGSLLQATANLVVMLAIYILITSRGGKPRALT